MSSNAPTVDHFLPFRRQIHALVLNRLINISHETLEDPVTLSSFIRLNKKMQEVNYPRIHDEDGADMNEYVDEILGMGHPILNELFEAWAEWCRDVGPIY